MTDDIRELEVDELENVVGGSICWSTIVGHHDPDHGNGSDHGGESK